MPLAFIAIGAVFLVAAVRGTVSDFATDASGKVTQGTPNNSGLTTLLKGDLTGTNNFLVWMLAFFVLGALGYIQGFKPIANALLVLVVVVLVITNNNKQGSGGFFAQFNAAIKGA